MVSVFALWKRFVGKQSAFMRKQPSVFPMSVLRIYVINIVFSYGAYTGAPLNEKGFRMLEIEFMG